ncbi:hypothetical protein GC207_09235 [bacterium]|nr:hypothetical protein [bacterium]
MDVLDLIREGAVLSAAVIGGAQMLLAPHAVIRCGRLVFYDLASGRARSLRFDAFEWAGDRIVWLIESGDRVAKVGSVWLEVPEAGQAWRRDWLDQPENEKNLLLKEFQHQVDALEF